MDAEHPAVAPRPKRGKRRGKRGGGTLQHRLEYVFVRVLGFFLRRLPVGATSALGGFAMGSIMPFTSKHKRAIDNLAYAMPDLDDAARDKIIRAMWRNLGRVSAEAFQIDKILKDDTRVALPDNFDELRERAANGVIAATAHFGNWEIASILAIKGGLPMAGVYQPLHNPFVEQYLKSMRAPGYRAGLHTKGPKLGQTLVRLAREGAAIGLVADFRELRGIPVTFFGKQAYATPLPAMLARLSGRPLIAGAVIRTDGSSYRVVTQEIEVPNTANRDADILAATQNLHDVYEDWIRNAPEQWMWTHRKWARARNSPPSTN